MSARFELRQDEDTGRRYWLGSEDGWKGTTEIGENGVLTLSTNHFSVGTVLHFEEPNDNIEDGLTFHELIAQPYTNCVISAGSVEGHPVDTLYLKLERDGHVDTFLLLRPDEAAALVWCLSGVLWSSLVENTNHA